MDQADSQDRGRDQEKAAQCPRFVSRDGRLRSYSRPAAGSRCTATLPDVEVVARAARRL